MRQEARGTRVDGLRAGEQGASEHADGGEYTGAGRGRAIDGARRQVDADERLGARCGDIEEPANGGIGCAAHEGHAHYRSIAHHGESAATRASKNSVPVRVRGAIVHMASMTGIDTPGCTPRAILTTYARVPHEKSAHARRPTASIAVIALPLPHWPTKSTPENAGPSTQLGFPPDAPGGSLSTAGTSVTGDADDAHEASGVPNASAKTSPGKG